MTTYTAHPGSRIKALWKSKKRRGEEGEEGEEGEGEAR
jgi:hypothetical protein